ncbi:conserved hypothetical protein [Roseovarius sp. EC-HK134]|uniref:DUF6270 domain-containing protein n=1 Tax=unclassified Roseovarius TaxID=2614913 RepID=UPI0012511B71|nr:MULTISPECIES: DUF6270 domain-containing protein [unclassified Roseovarius]VVS96357.1 conserved hypothetical protein [Roseovarius sp. EC-SD190]VVT34141.1 conserved hypothetical protein [Roseovarius sp. EC-HK134]
MGVFIFGSCVSRDAFSLIPNDLLLSGYVARSSFGSAFASERFPLSIDELDPDCAIQSALQRSMVAIDLDKSAATILTRAAPSTDLVIVDFIDERFQLAVAGDTCATSSVAFREVGKKHGFVYIPSMEEEHFQRWKQGFRTFLDLAQSLSLPVVLNAVRLGGASRTGQLIPEIKYRPLEDYLDRLYACVEKTGRCEIFRNPCEPFLDECHKWGVTPFHYENRYYRPLIAHIAKLAKSPDRKAGTATLNR